MMVASDRIYAFDVTLHQTHPYKGQGIKTWIAAWMLNASKDIIPNYFLEVPPPNISISKKCIHSKYEMLARGNLNRTYLENLQ